jgi:D-inositol-3-phosphate glycosyltransferase
MTVQRVAAFSVHTSPLAPPGRGDGGGMNVYVSSLSSALAQAGVECDIFTRRAADEPEVVELEAGLRVVHIDAGPRTPLPKERLVAHLDEFVLGARAFMERQPFEYDILHAHYWMSGVVAHRLKHELELPLVSTFHTLALVKQAAGVVALDDAGDDRARAERDVVRCSDLVLVSTPLEQRDLVTRYDADGDRIEVLAPGVDHERFQPGDRAVERRRLGLTPDAGIVLFAGRIQPLKGADIAVRAVAELGDDRTQLLVIGDPSGPDGDRELARLHELVRTLGLDGRVHFVGAVAHDALPAYYRAADVCVVPSRSESFGLVALEAGSCGTPVVAAAVGGLQSIVVDGITGHLVDSRAPHDYAAAIAKVLGDPAHAAEMGAAAASAARRYSWHITAARLRRLFGDLAVAEPVQCR